MNKNKWTQDTGGRHTTQTKKHARTQTHAQDVDAPSKHRHMRAHSNVHVKQPSFPTRAWLYKDAFAVTKAGRCFDALLVRVAASDIPAALY